jgi:hypothetical protein
MKMELKKWIIAGVITAGFLINLSFGSAKDYGVGDLNNIEALSLGEDNSGFCLGLGSLDCPFFNLKVKSYYY